MSLPISDAISPPQTTATPDAGTVVLPWFSLLGPVALGCALGLGSGPTVMLQRSLGLLALVVGLTGALAPALYIGLSMADGSVPAQRLKRALGRALSATGVAMAGLTPATLFLVSTASSSGTVSQLGTLVAGFSAVLGVRRLGDELLPAPVTSAPRAALVFAVWSVIALLLGGHLFQDLLESGRAT